MRGSTAFYSPKDPPVSRRYYDKVVGLAETYERQGRPRQQTVRMLRALGAQVLILPWKTPLGVDRMRGHIVRDFLLYPEGS